MKRIGQAVFYSARRRAPMDFIVDPTLSLGDVCPGAHIGQPLGQRVDVALGPVDPVDLALEPVRRHPALFMQEPEDPAQKRGMFGVRDAAKVGNPANIPQKTHRGGCAGAGANLGLLGQRAQRHQIVGLAGAHQKRVVAALFERGNQRIETREIQRIVAPLQLFHRGKMVAGDGLGHFGRQRRRFAGHAERAILGMAPGPPGDLGQFVREQVAHAPPVEFPGRRKGHVTDIEVQAHADGVGGDQKIDLALLIHRHLRVARARAERPHHHRRAAHLAADQLGNGIDVVDRETDNGRPGVHAPKLSGPGIGKLGKTLAPQEMGLWHQCGDGPAHGFRAQKQRLEAPARLEQPVGKDMATLGVGAKLNFVDGQKVTAQTVGHRLDRADPIGRVLGHDPLFPGDQRHHAGAAHRNDAVIDLAGKQAQRQPDDAALVRQHPLDRVMGLAGVGGSQDRRDPA